MDESKKIKTNSLKAWILATRPKTLTGAMAPVIVGGAQAYYDILTKSSSNIVLTTFEKTIQPHIVFLICLIFALLMQIDANLVNDYFDYKKGTDRDDRLGPKRACAQGWITPKAMKTGIYATTISASVFGLILFLYVMQWELIAVGIACVIGCFLYSIKFSYLGLGDVLVLLFFGIIPVGFTYYVMMGGQWTWSVTLAGIGMGLVTDNLLMVNNYRDVEQDRLSGKRTIVVRFGKEIALKLYFWLGIIAMASGIVAEMIDVTNPIMKIWLVIPWGIYLMVHLNNFKKMRLLTGKALNKTLGSTAASIILYAIVFASTLLINATA